MLAQEPERAHPDFNQFQTLQYLSLPARVYHLDHLRITPSSLTAPGPSPLSSAFRFRAILSNDPR